MDQPVRTERDRAHHLGRRQADQHHLRACGHIGGRACGLGALGHERVHCLDGGVVHDQLVTGREEPPGNRPAHLTKSYITDRSGHGRIVVSTTVL